MARLHDSWRKDKKVYLEGDWVRDEDGEHLLVECTECGSGPEHPCTAEDPEREGFGVEVCNWVHTARADAPDTEPE